MGGGVCELHTCTFDWLVAIVLCIACLIKTNMEMRRKSLMQRTVTPGLQAE